MWEKYRHSKTICFLVNMIATPFAMIAMFLGWEWIAIPYVLLVVGGAAYTFLKFKCPCCGYPLERIARSHKKRCPRCGMDIPEKEEEIDRSYFKRDEM